MTPLLLLLLLTSLAGTVISQSNDDRSVDHSGEIEVVETTATNLEVGQDNLKSSELSANYSSALNTSISIFKNASAEPEADHTPGSGRAGSNVVDEDEAFPNNSSPTDKPDNEDLSLIIILVPLVLAIVIIAMVVGGILIKNRCTTENHRKDQNKEDPYLDGPSVEKVPMPMFEDDVPSVLELEMEDLEQWMKKEGGDGLDSGKI